MNAPQENDLIMACVDSYTEGVRDGDVVKLRNAFHPNARCWGMLAGARLDVPIEEMIMMFDGAPVDVNGSYKSQVAALDRTEDIASVTLVEEGYWGTASFVDSFTLARIDGSWTIVNKAFVHTGGDLPSAEDADAETAS